MSVKSKTSKFVYKVCEVFCICRDVFFEEDVEKEPENFMAECSTFGEWYHCKCEATVKEVFVKPNTTWECSFCLKCFLSTHCFCSVNLKISIKFFTSLNVFF